MDYKNLILRASLSIFIILVIFLPIMLFPEKLYYIFLIIYIIVLFEIYKYFNNLKFKIILYLYIIFSFISLEIYLYLFYNLYLFVYLFLIIFVFDTVCYLLGSAFGKKRIFIFISPNKTYFGLFSGIVFTLILSYIYNYYFELFDFYNFVIFNFVIIIFSFVGDLIQSYYKRKSKLKDSGKLIPGHGGFFDRFDSLIMSSYALLIFSIFYN
tara:strand:- start:27 stop:659 length:633 start_codon:yes stop_codon:yes gene_type:complete